MMARGYLGHAEAAKYSELTRRLKYLQIKHKEWYMLAQATKTSYSVIMRRDILNEIDKISNEIEKLRKEFIGE